MSLISCGKTAPPRNIILVTVDTLRSDRLHCYGYPHPISPAVDRLAGKGILFQNCRAHSSSTAPCLASLMTGLYPSEAGVMSNKYPLLQSANTLALAMKGRGYRTAAFVSNYNLRPNMNFFTGFDHYDAEMTDHEVNRLYVHERTAEKTTEAALQWMKEHLKGENGSFFVWLHYQDPHGPYTPPEETVPDLASYTKKTLSFNKDNWTPGGIPLYQAQDGHRDLAFYEARYDGEILFFDRQFMRFLDYLDTSGLCKSTVVVFTADHGESMGEHDFWFSHGQDLYEELVRVPLIVVVPGEEPARSEDPVCHMDIFPTLLALAGLEARALDTYRGKDLLDDRALKENRYIYSEMKNSPTKSIMRSIVSGPWKMISIAPTLRAKGEMSREFLLFNLKNDPGETTNLFQAEREVAKRLRKLLLLEEKRSLEAQMSTPLQYSQKELQTLKSLGYTGD